MRAAVSALVVLLLATAAHADPLPTILVDGDAVSPRDWAVQPFSVIDEGIAAADGVSITSHDDTTLTEEDTAFTLQSTPANFLTMTALNWTVKAGGGSGSLSEISLGIRIVNGATVLAAGSALGAFQTVRSYVDGEASEPTGPTAFSYVNILANKAAWDGAQVELRATLVNNDSAEFALEVDTLELTGTYVADAVATPTPTATSTATPTPTDTPTPTPTDTPTPTPTSTSTATPTATATATPTATATNTPTPSPTPTIGRVPWNGSRQKWGRSGPWQ